MPWGRPKAKKGGKQASACAAWGLFLLVLLSMALAGCAATESKLAVPYEIRFETAQDVNPDSSGRPSPIQITLYELKTPGAFQAADYFSLQGKARETLGADLLDVQRLTLMPGQQLELERSGHVEARALGIVAGYRDLDASAWRLLLDLPKSRSTNIYKFWQFSPGGAEIELGVNQKGVTIISYDD
ncbi:type VI secretion system lipoprotein TssJ [Pusillimonas noertemannii]|uniref:type VI secretion system lipoprotein TssJ n=1 Tax=Pusillimonas noertemannii TaxID=305977 RepID=UPI001FCC687C|nr:type VI secretion system lipoprotein TssJ [Pusillimonas noertemannii]